MFLIKIKRRVLQKTCCLGEVEVYKDGKLQLTLKTLEEEIESDERGQDHRIPEGEYKCKWHFGSRFTKRLSDICGFECPPLHLYNDRVPADRYILIHPGNTHKDTEGCILLGSDYGADMESITASAKACEKFYKLLNRCNINDIIIKIENRI